MQIDSPSHRERLFAYVIALQSAINLGHLRFSTGQQNMEYAKYVRCRGVNLCGKTVLVKCRPSVQKSRHRGSRSKSWCDTVSADLMSIDVVTVGSGTDEIWMNGRYFPAPTNGRGPSS